MGRRYLAPPINSVRAVGADPFSWKGFKTSSAFDLGIDIGVGNVKGDRGHGRSQKARTLTARTRENIG